MIEDHWLASPIFRLLALVITGYLSYELIPHRWLSFGLAIGGGCAFSLGALASLRGGRALSGVWGAQRQLSRGLRRGLYLLLILSARLYYAHTMEQSTGGLLPLEGKLTAIIEARETSPEPVGERSVGTEAVGSRTEAVGRRIGEVGSAIIRAVHGAGEGAPFDLSQGVLQSWCHVHPSSTGRVSVASSLAFAFGSFVPTPAFAPLCAEGRGESPTSRRYPCLPSPAGELYP